MTHDPNPVPTTATADHDDDHDDFGGLDRDLPRFLGRRRALGLLAGGTMAGLLVACGSSKSSDSSATTAAASGGSGSTASNSGSSGSSSSSSGSSDTDEGTTGGSTTETVPQETGGPYPGDGTNGPNVLTESGVVRQDIRTSFGDASGTAEGVPLQVDLKIIDVSGGGGAKAGAAVYIWHCTADGAYSMYTGDAENENYLRGVQVADDDGNLSFTTIFPGAYSGRWPHIHFEVYADVDAATAAGQKLVTSQIALPEEQCAEVYATDGYGNSTRNLEQSSLSSDNVFSDGWSTQLATVTGSVADGYTATLNVGV
jgi:protocatechuate 3,4-dioxygenase beta subunit